MKRKDSKKNLLEPSSSNENSYNPNATMEYHKLSKVFDIGDLAKSAYHWVFYTSQATNELDAEVQWNEEENQNSMLRIFLTKQRRKTMYQQNETREMQTQEDTDITRKYWIKIKWNEERDPNQKIAFVY